MAGSLTTPIHEHHHRGNAAASEYSRWLIDFARFIPYPSSPSTRHHHPGLFPLGKRELNSPPHGTWLSTSCSTASLQLVDEVNRSDAILFVSLDGKVLEEHYISNLNFSWPQMTCVSGFPPRGSRAILVSYKDSENEIQKFALRFSTCDAAETFVVALKEKFKGLEECRIQRSDIRSEISFQSDYNNTSTEIYPRANVEEPNMVTPLDSYDPEMLPRLEATVEEANMVEPLGSYVPEMVPRLEYETVQTSYQPQSALSQISNETPINLPPSFTTLLSGCFPNSTLAAGQTSVKQDPDLKSQILKYMEDSAFQDMLQKVERIMDEIGGNWVL
ncbi:unnamed protein product [Arabis nemorensis]|uniref:Poor homologous synapsis 1 PH domain-containing protein n=1 Tax=Arabis nemorensis TaxID=586526 RepID=A0A565AN80_9BRAS|nr:unnamed protein product [Arabis nemorensis]